jgi:adenosylcobyric acid synthase
MCLEPEERSLVKGFILNRFRGDPDLLGNAMDWLLQKTGIPTVAIIPFVRNALPEEDRLFHRGQLSDGGISIALIAYPYASNMDEFDPLIHESGVTVVTIGDLVSLDGYSAIILPGTKNTEQSLRFLRETGLDAELARAAARGKTIVGVCGGMQLLGHRIDDPYRLEGEGTEGLGLLDISTMLNPEKVTLQRHIGWKGGGIVRGYEIHHGRTTPGPAVHEHLADGLGWEQGSIRGVYLHGLFENTSYRQHFLNALGWQGHSENWFSILDTEIERVASTVQASGWVVGRAADLGPSRIQRSD